MQQFYAPSRLVLFDLDHTLVDADSNAQWIAFLLDDGRLPRDPWEADTEAALARYRKGRFDAAEYQSFFVGTLASFLPETLAELLPRYVRERLLPNVVPGASKLLDRHRARADLLVLTSATNRFLTAPVARALGFEHLIATEVQMIGARYTGRIDGVPNMREGKVARLEQWLERRGWRLQDIPESVFYSDSVNDLPLLERVTQPVATDPDEPLQLLARQRGWPVLSLRSSPRDLS